VTPATMRALMHVCSARLDEKVSAVEFVRLVETLLDATHEAAVRETLGTDDIDRPAPSSRIPLDAEPPPSSSRMIVDKISELEPQPPYITPKTETDPPARAPHVTPTRAKPGRLSFDDKVRIRKRYDESIEGRQRAPFGFIPGLAAEYGVPVTTIRTVCYRRDGT